MTQHTIVLTQVQQNKPESQKWEDFPTLSEAVEGIISKFEQRLKHVNPTVRNIRYDISDLQKYIDSFGDVCCMVLDPQSSTYVPHDREWLKQKVFSHLKKQARSQ